MRGLSDFEGAWAITREITDFTGGPDARLTGQCTFAPEGAGLTQAEVGTLQFAGSSVALKAERRYFWTAQGNEIAVFFDDTRFFHAFDPRGGTAQAEHDCPPDRYEVRYGFGTGALLSWTVEWRVRGPRKDYLSLTQFSRGPVPVL
ncbi:DUF6314 family protein [Celeribacter sp.]|uniref:DUF6314 family protein n=1 Tax=Celeribacter sp. TaxID=1890673 RepID=UPI003A944FD2